MNRKGAISGMIRDAKNFFRTSDDAVIYFEDYGKGDPIVILHGFLCSSKFFRKNIEGLSKDHRLILIDWRGHGSSSKTLTGLDMPRCARDVREIIDFLKLDRVTLLGWSMGSSVVMAYWEQFRDFHLKALGVIDSALYPFSPEEWNSHSLKGFNMDGMNAVVEKAVTDHDAYCRAFARVVFKTPPCKEDEDWITAEMKKLPPWIAFALYNDFLHRDYATTLKTVTVPLLICCADSPAIPKGIAMGTYYRDLVGGACSFHTFPDEGHVMFYENPEKFNRVVLDFVDRYAEGITKR